MLSASLLAVALAAFTRISLADNAGYATYSNGQGGVCSGASSGLPAVSMNAAQFGDGSACGQCVQIQGTGNGAGQDPVSTAPYIAVVTNVCPQCAPGDIDLQESGNGKFGITWSFTACPGSGRKLIEGSRKLIVDEQRTTQIRVSETFTTVDKDIPSSQEQQLKQKDSELVVPTNEVRQQEEQSQQTNQPVNPTSEQYSQSTEASSQDVGEESVPSRPAAASLSKEGPVSRKILL